MLKKKVEKKSDSLFFLLHASLIAFFSFLDLIVAAKVWVSEKAPLFSQGCDSSTTLFFRHKYWFHDSEEIVDPTTLQLMFEEVDGFIDFTYSFFFFFVVVVVCLFLKLPFEIE